MSGFQLAYKGRRMPCTNKPSLKRGERGFRLEKALKALFLFYGIISCLSLNAQYAPIGQFQLAPPSIEVTETFFGASTTVRLDLDAEGVELRYSLTGEEVNENSTLYEGAITLQNSTTIKAKAFHSDYRTSKEVQFKVFKTTKGEAMKVSCTHDPAPQYAGNGVESLADFRKGSMNFRDGHWLGFSRDTIVFEVEAGTRVGQLNLSILEDHGSWIFAPGQVEIWKGQQLLGSWVGTSPAAISSKVFRFIEVPLESPAKGILQLKVMMEKIPDWHDGKGTTPWLFIDEIFISN